MTPTKAAESKKGPCQVALVNDYELIVAGLRAALSPYKSRIEVVELDIDKGPGTPVDVALFDTFGQPGLGLSRVKDLVANPNVGALAVYAWEMPAAGRAAVMAVGARGLISKTLPTVELVEALEAVHRGEAVDTGRFHGASGGPWPGSRWDLTARESEILALLTTGMSNRSLAEGLFITENTVRTHLKSIFRKLHVANRSQALALALSEPSFMTRQTRIIEGSPSP